MGFKVQTGQFIPQSGPSGVRISPIIQSPITKQFNVTQSFDNVLYSKYPTGNAPGGGQEPPATIIVRADGGGHYTNLQTAINNASPGDVIEVQANAPGGTFTYSNSLNFSSVNSGTPSSYITLRNRDGDTLILNGSGISGTIIDLVGKSYWVFKGLGGRDKFQIGNQTGWTGQAGGFSGPYQYTMYIEGEAHHILFIGLSIFGNATSSFASIVKRGCHHFLFDDCEISKHGNNVSGSGDVLRVFAGHSIIKNSTIKWGGHDSLWWFAPHSVIRNCFLDGDWTSLATGFPGRRIMDWNPGGYDEWSPTVGGNHHTFSTTDRYEFGPSLMEDCSARMAGLSGSDTTDAPAIKAMGFRLIDRGNLYYDIVDGYPRRPDSALLLQDTTNMFPGPAYAECYRYNNTHYNTEGVESTGADGYPSPPNPAPTGQKHRTFNNIFADLHDQPKSDRGVVYWNKDGLLLDGWSNYWKGNKWFSNIFQGNAANMDFELDLLERSIASGAATEWGADLFFNNTVQVGALNFSNSSGRTLADLTITSGIGFQDADPVTTTTGSGTSTTLPVEESWGFYDGDNINTWDLGVFGEVPDYIAVGSTIGAATIVQIDSIQNDTTIILKNSISFNNGDGVWFAGNPNGNFSNQIWDNRGAGQ